MDKAFYCPSQDCGNMAFEPGVCSACGSNLEEEDMIGTDETLEGWPCRAGFAPDIGPADPHDGSPERG